ncbi:MAG: bifunctional demethylmenaquinone methyltransferase/2-methoxy-6-polyprenyl-1,4-benzoquinol methylase UbiE [Bacteroidales bacterium]|nr:bifunctional demethylmenaquinone methyltransferase/2-methoxy-6-polyprenyl-1,4-benzoquinol methylase UbiE [Bacteroidales bacterium]
MGNLKEISDQGKKATVASMFDSIAGRYDFLNHFLSFGIDRCWRKTAIKIISGTHKNQMKILDVATGTGDLAIAAMKLNPWHITGIDISRKMLEAGREKIRRKGLSDKIDLIEFDSENICFDDNSFDVAMVAFGVRNFADPVKGLTEMRRVIRNGGLILVLEFSKPVRFPFRQIYNFYFLNILPFIGRIFSKNRNAYRYLPDSVMQFPDNERFISLLENAAFTNVRQKKLTGGIASIYTGIKP